MLTHLDLFSGYGGFSLGLKLAIPNIRTVGYVEWEGYPQKIIAARIKDGHLDEAPIFGDIRAFNSEGYAEQYRGLVDVVTGGFPCQPFSVAGKQKGEADERNMWPATLETIRLVRPEIVLLENVPVLLSNEYIRQIYGDLAAAEYDIVGDCVSAAECGANHKRKRLWIMAYPDRAREPQPQGSKQNQRGRTCNSGEDLAHSHIKGLPKLQRGSPDAEKPRIGATCNSSWWETEPPLGRVVDGCPNRVGQLKALGNGIVPAVAAEFLRRIKC